MMDSHNGHRKEVEEKSTPLGRHFSQCGLNNFSLQIIAGVKEGEEEDLDSATSHNAGAGGIECKG